MSTTNRPEAACVAWRARAEELADWALVRFFVRDDRYGGYYVDQDAGGVLAKAARPKVATPGAVTRDLLMRHFRAKGFADVVGSYSLAPGVSTGRTAFADIDAHDPGDDPVLNKRYAEHLYAKLVGAGFSPLAADYGEGSFHVGVLFDTDVPGPVLLAFGSWLVRDAKAFGMPGDVERFPKQSTVLAGKFGNWLRLIGRHHKRDAWATVFDGTTWLEGGAAVAHVLSLSGDSPDRIPAEAAPQKPPEPGPTRPAPGASASAPRGSAPRDRRDVFEAYNRTVPLDAVVEWHTAAGHTVIHASAERVNFARMGKTGGESFNVKLFGGVPITYNFSNRAGVPDNKGLSPSQVRCFYARGACDTATMKAFADVLRAEMGWTAPNRGQESRGYRDRVREERAADGVASSGADPSDVDSPTSSGNTLPDIIHNQRQYRDVESDALSALVRANDPPTVFVGNGCGLVDLLHRPDSPLSARELEPASMRGVFGRVANWVKITQLKDGIKYEDDFPPAPLLTSFPARASWPGLPSLKSVVTYPVFGPGWTLNASPGYHPSSFIYCDLAQLVMPPVSSRPSVEEVDAARELIVTDLFGDFPFVDQASRANAVAMLILPVIRHAIDGPTPLAIIDAPAQGTGKSLLAEVATLATIGEIPEAVSPDMSDEEWNKFLLAELIAGQPIIYLDNANKKVDSGSLASALTAKWKRGRVLGESTIARARVCVSWLLTGNNIEVSGEIARRVYWIRIDRGIENPAEHSGYRHDDIYQWVRDNRARLISAIITLVNNWISKGKPPGSEQLGKFEAWSRVVGGILAAAGIDGLLGNASEFRRLCANEANEMPEFVRVWWERHGTAPVITADLFEYAKDVLESVLSAENEKGQRKQLGRFLKKQRDRVYIGYQIVALVREDGKPDKDYAGRQRYKLKQLKSHAKAQPPKEKEYADSDDGFEIKA